MKKQQTFTVIEHSISYGRKYSTERISENHGQDYPVRRVGWYHYAVLPKWQARSSAHRHRTDAADMSPADRVHMTDKK